jgi:hypothetical protein
VFLGGEVGTNMIIDLWRYNKGVKDLLSIFGYCTRTLNRHAATNYIVMQSCCSIQNVLLDRELAS